MRRTTTYTIAAVLAAVPGLAGAQPATPDVLGEVFFAFDSARLPANASGRLDDVARWAREHPTARIVLDGNADPQGPAPYNVGLAARRARTVQSRLIARGIGPARIYLVTYGEDNLPRGSYPEDRRVTMWTTDDPLYEIVDHSLGRATAILWTKPVTAAQIEGPTREQTARR